MAGQDPKLYGDYPRVREALVWWSFRNNFPSNYFDVAIADKHAVTFAAGLARRAQPVVAIYSTFYNEPTTNLSRRGLAKSAGIIAISTVCV